MQTIKTPIYQSQQIREFERIASERFGVNGQVLMQRAGKAAFDFLHKRWPQAHKVAVFCGGGNNGGDGYVLALNAFERGLEVAIWQVGEHHHPKPEARDALAACRSANIPIHTFNERVNINHPDVIVDAICGIGARENLRDEILAAIKKMHKQEVPIFALDIPTGIDADTGRILGAAVRATATITFIGLKLGLLTGSGSAHTGELICHDLQMPAELFALSEPVASKLHLSSYANFLKPRARDWHKGLSGHVLVVGGGIGYLGAPRMASEAAVRVGAGLVTIATHPDHFALMSIACPEIMSFGIDGPHDLHPLFERADAIVLGPGLTQTTWARSLWEYVCKQPHPMVVDADGLNLLANSPQVRENWVLTPHPGEAARLLGISPEEVQSDRLAAVKAIQNRYGGVCVLKGAGSLVLAPNSLPALCDKGNPGMATAGMGDVLSGVIGGLLGAGIPLGDAAKLGVYLHAAAGDLAAKEGERGMIAMDLMPYLRRLSNQTGH